jgi:hypothetical protein
MRFGLPAAIPTEAVIFATSFIDGRLGSRLDLFLENSEKWGMPLADG